MRMLIAIVLLCSALSAQADSVYICTNPAAEGTRFLNCCAYGSTRCNLKDGGYQSMSRTPQPDALVAVGVAENKLGLQNLWYGKPDLMWRKLSSTDANSKIGVCLGDDSNITECRDGYGGQSALKLKSEIAALTPIEPPPAPEFQFSGYPCKPKSWEELRWGRDGSAAAAVWYCDQPHVLSMHYYCGNPANIPVQLLTNSLEAVGLIAESKVSRVCTEAERAVVDQVHASKGVTITVAPSFYETRPVYSRNEDNTRGSTIKGARAAIGEPCGRKRLQTTDGKPTNYHQFGDGYTLCKVEGAVSAVSK